MINKLISSAILICILCLVPNAYSLQCEGDCDVDKYFFIPADSTKIALSMQEFIYPAKSSNHSDSLSWLVHYEIEFTQESMKDSSKAYFVAIAYSRPENASYRLTKEDSMTIYNQAVQALLNSDMKKKFYRPDSLWADTINNNHKKFLWQENRFVEYEVLFALNDSLSFFRNSFAKIMDTNYKGSRGNLVYVTHTVEYRCDDFWPMADWIYTISKPFFSKNDKETNWMRPLFFRNTFVYGLPLFSSSQMIEKKNFFLLRMYGSPYFSYEDIKNDTTFKKIQNYIRDYNLDSAKIQKLVFENRDSIRIQEIHPKYSALGFIYNMRQKKNNCEMQFYPYRIYQSPDKKDDLDGRKYVEDLFYMLIDSTRFIKLTKNKKFNLKKSGTCLDVEYLNRPLWIFSDKKKGTIALDSILTPDDYLYDGKNLVNFSMGLPFDSLYNAFLPKEFNIRDVHLDLQNIPILVKNLPKKFQKEFEIVFEKIKQYAKMIEAKEDSLKKRKSQPEVK